ncbi:beta-N-acetylglucosaminidase domain-containing protein [Pseudactinotalea sp. HY158]|uniref:beta-N-acetylglucosaminidase domain-containing protein n=1 Tax=Pseudactinotalea sp. HY158 TaxID=2654547 RepID=UPI0018924086|nr:beta-N-acetylglucosaminidase domain-containing protein [Pseudactinotalea sp. HY158]
MPRSHPMRPAWRRPLVLAACAAVAATGALAPLTPAPAAAASGPAAAEAGPVVAEPQVTPTPQQADYSGTGLELPERVSVVAGEGADEAALDLLGEVLRGHGITPTRLEVPGRAEAGDVVLTLGDGAELSDELAGAGLAVPDRGEAYALGVDAQEGAVLIAGSDGAGQFYGVQTLRQLFVETGAGDVVLAGASITDFPAMALRGTVEGFYGPRWSHEGRLDQFDFYGDVKLNTYIFAPKNDPYHRAKWREPYPADQIAEIAELVAAADANHVRFTFALSPGQSICYTSPEDYAALVAKLEQAYDVGVRSFSVPLDDITLSSWHCDADQAAYGDPSNGTHGQAQVDLLNKLNADFIAGHSGVLPLQTVPTQYNTVTESPYKQAYREGLDSDIVVMWTGTATVPVHIGVDDAQDFLDVYGTPAFLWDNYPVNDFKRAAGRLLLAPYQEREAGLSEVLSGIASNPMNYPAASKVAVFTIADFAWNDAAYDPAASSRRAAEYLAGGDDATADALMLFFDLNSFGPGCTPRCADAEGPGWLPPAPKLADEIAEFEAAWAGGRRAEAIAGLRPVAAAMQAAPGIIRAGVADELFLAETSAWLDATADWGAVLDQALTMLETAAGGDLEAAAAQADAVESAMIDAQSVVVGTDELRYEGLLKLADQVLDRFVVDALLRARNWDLFDGTARNLAAGSNVSASSWYGEQDKFRPANAIDATWVPKSVKDERWGSVYDKANPENHDDEWLQVELAEPSLVPRVEIRWEGACAAEFQIQTSLDGVTWNSTEVSGVDDANACITPQAVEVDGDDPVLFVRMQGVESKGRYGYSIFEFMPIGVPVVDDLARQATGTAASSVKYDRVDFQPEYAIDGDVYTCWSSWRTDEEWMQLEFDRPIRADLARLAWEVDGACAEAYRIQTSTDGQTWTDVADVADSTCATTSCRWRRPGR